VSLASVRSRVVGLYLFLLLGVFTFFGVFLFVEMRESFRKDLDADVREEAAEVVGGFVQHLRDRKPEWVETFVEGLKDAFPRRGIVDFRGPPTEASITFPPRFRGAIAELVPEPGDGALGVTEARSIRIPNVPAGEAPYRAVALAFLDAGGNRWVCRLAYPLATVQQRLDAFVGRYLLASAFLFLAFFGGGWLLAGRALAPVAAMTEAARRIDRRSLAERLPVPGARDEIRALAETFNELLARVESAFAEVERVTADAAHELRTPIARIRTEVELAIGRSREPEADGETLESVLAGVARLTRLVDDILLLARADAGALGPRLSEIKVAPLLEGVRETAEVLGAPRSIRVSVAPVPEELAVRGDAEMLERMLLNLAHNGIRHNRDEGLLEISAAALGQEVRIRVADTGDGIPADQLPLVFRRFFRVDEARSSGGGTGLGLAIAAAIAAAHRGRIDVASEEGRGSVFTVTLPLFPPPPGHAGGERTGDERRRERATA